MELAVGAAVDSAVGSAVGVSAVWVILPKDCTPLRLTRARTVLIRNFMSNVMNRETG